VSGLEYPEISLRAPYRRRGGDRSW
jgi:hypothetical protein